MTFEVKDGGLIMVKCNSLESIIELPESIEGLPLKGIGEEGFAYCSHLQYLDIPEGVEIIGDRAFYYCSNLREIVLPTTLTDEKFGDHVFDYCAGYTIFCVPNSFSYWLAVNNKLAWKEGTSISVVLHE